LTVFAGPNGAGKSTIYEILKPLGQLINPDAIESALPSNFTKADREKAAARAALDGIRLQLARKEDFVVETTLSGNRPIRLMEEAKALGYRVELVFVCLDSVERSIKRVDFRVKVGGHDIPTEVILRRFPRVFANLPKAVKLADEVAIIDNSTMVPRWVLKIEQGEVTYFDITTSLDRQLRSLLGLTFRQLTKGGDLLE
jgi:predicted ABC-type ATPase